MMLVQSRSTSCGVCQKRKVKCDKSRPSCSQCVREGWECDGYKIVWREKPRSKGSKQYSQYESQWVLERKTRYSVTPQHKYPKRSKALTQTATNPCPTEGPHYSLTSASLALAQKLVGLLEEDKGLGMKIQSLGLFIFEIPSRLGNSQALDDAMECICSAYVSVLQPICHKSEQDRHQYFQALKSLRQCILDETQALSSNVLAAAVLLSWYEILAQNLDNGWLAHIRGCGNLIQARGPWRLSTKFDKSLMDAVEGFVCAQSLISCTPSFLASPHWQSALYSDQSLEYQGDRFLQPLRTLVSKVARISVLLSEFDSLRNCVGKGIYREAEIRTVLQHYATLRNELQLDLVQGNLECYTGTDQLRGGFLTNKRYLALWKMDAHLFELLHLLGPRTLFDETLCNGCLSAIRTNEESPPLIQHKSQAVGFFPLAKSDPSLSSSSQNLYIHSLILDRLDASIYHSTSKIKEYMLFLKHADPFGLRRMAFIWRMLCTEAIRRGSVHLIWEEMETWLGDLIQDVAERITC